MEDVIREKLLLFMFLLLRDYITIGDFNKIVKYIKDVPNNEDIVYTDVNLADFVKHQLNKVIN